jgi:hypothetical protein
MYFVSTANGIKVEDIDSGSTLVRRIHELSGQPLIGLSALRAVEDGEELRIGCRPGSEGFEKFGLAGFVVRKAKQRRPRPQPRRNFMEYTAAHVRGATPLIWPDCPPPPQQDGEPDYEFHDPTGEFCSKVMAGLMYQLYPPRAVTDEDGETELRLPMVN